MSLEYLLDRTFQATHRVGVGALLTRAGFSSGADLRARRPSWRLRLHSFGSANSRTIECLLAIARGLAIGGAAIVGIDAVLAGDRPHLWGSLAYAAITAVLILSRRSSLARSEVQIVAHLGDLVAALVFGLLVPGLQLVTLPVYVFALLAAVLRWGGRAMFASMIAIAVALLCRAGIADLPHASASPWPGLPYESLTAFLGFLVLTSPVVAYFGAVERQRRAERSAARRLVTRVRVDQGFTASLQAVLEDLVRLFDARGAELVTYDDTTGRSFIWELNTAPTAERALRCRETSGTAADKMPGSSRARPVRPLDRGLSTPFLAGDWSGRLVVLDPALGRDRAGAARFLARALHEVTPALVNVYTLTRVRARAVALERSRLASALHDRVIQSLIGAEMHVDVLRRGARSAPRPEQFATELAGVQEILHQEILNLRDVMLQMKPLDVRAEQLPGVLAELVDRFAHDTGMEAMFSAPGSRSPLSRRACSEIVRIVQEALCNVRKHSGARHVLVRMSSTPAGSAIAVEDDGRGFGFEGRITFSANHPMGRHEPMPGVSAARTRSDRPSPRSSIPAVIRDSVRALGGELTIESVPGRGACLEITIPAEPQFAAPRKYERKAS